MISTKDTSRFDYLRFRPFLAITVAGQPAPRVRTERKGWTKTNANMDLVDYPAILDRISNNTMRQATVIIDLMTETLVKNRYRRSSPDVQPDAMDEQILKHFLSKYSEMIDQARNTWMLGGVAKVV